MSQFFRCVCRKLFSKLLALSSRRPSDSFKGIVSAIGNRCANDDPISNSRKAWFRPEFPSSCCNYTWGNKPVQCFHVLSSNCAVWIPVFIDVKRIYTYWSYSRFEQVNWNWRLQSYFVEMSRHCMMLQLFRGKELYQEVFKINALFFKRVKFIPGRRSGEFEAQVFLEVIERKEIDFVLERKRTFGFLLAFVFVLRLTLICGFKILISLTLITFVSPSIISCFARLTSSVRDEEQSETRFWRTPSSTCSISFFR